MPPPETSIAPGLAAHAAAGARALLVQAAAHDWRGPDPYDGLYFRWPAWLTAGRRRRQVIVQAHARAPVDIRRLYRRTHPQIAKALGVFGSVGMRLARGGDRDAAALALAALDLLDGDRTGGSVAWGYPFDVQTRWSFYPAGSPNVVVTSFAVEALLEGAAAADRPRLKARAVGAAQWVLDELWVQRDGFFAYHPTADVNIHNANLLGAVCVHHALGSDPAARECVSRAIERTLAAQAPDGGFPYGEGPGLAWRDSFHTGFVLRCLVEMDMIDPAIGEAVRRGAESYLTFFDAGGRAKLFAEREHPEDAHLGGDGVVHACAAQRPGCGRPGGARTSHQTHGHGRPPSRSRRGPALPLGGDDHAVPALV